MNKFVIIGIVLVIIVVGGAFLGKDRKPVETGVIKEITVVSLKDRWEFSPDTLNVDQGDRVILTLVNEDDYDHGIGIDAFGISQRLPANESITVEFVASKTGEFPFYCSVSCGSGTVDGVERGHFDHLGKLFVNVKEALTE